MSAKEELAQRLEQMAAFCDAGPRELMREAAAALRTPTEQPAEGETLEFDALSAKHLKILNQVPDNPLLMLATTGIALAEYEQLGKQCERQRNAARSEVERLRLQVERLCRSDTSGADEIATNGGS